MTVGTPAVVQFAALISIVVTVALFALTQYLTLRQRRSEARGAAVAATLDALDRAARRNTWPTVARLWHKPEVEGLSD
jgi:hypothetical protein